MDTNRSNIIRCEERIKLPNTLLLNVRSAKDWDNVVARRLSHNIVVNQGRNWLRGLIGASSFQKAATAPLEYPGKTGSLWTVDDALQPPFNNYRLRYMSLGAGGTFGGGTYTESVAINGLEIPVQMDLGGTKFIQECLPSPSGADLDVFPTAYDFAARCVWGSEDISYSAVPGPGFSVDVSEIAIFTSETDPAVVATGAGSLTDPTGCPGLVAWNCFSPVPKTQDVVFEAIWLWRF